MPEIILSFFVWHFFLVGGGAENAGETNKHAFKIKTKICVDKDWWKFFSASWCENIYTLGESSERFGSKINAQTRTQHKVDSKISPNSFSFQFFRRFFFFIKKQNTHTHRRVKEQNKENKQITVASKLIAQNLKIEIRHSGRDEASWWRCQTWPPTKFSSIINNQFTTGLCRW